jgi:nucleotidyltransferase/DNA polymerase involved in DNA repair
MHPPRVVLHVDMDAFYAAVEVRENPELAGKPLIIGHEGRRGVVSTCSYEARKFGVRSAMPSVVAARLCPDAVWLPGRMELYIAVSATLRRIFDEQAPVVEPLSIDEAFLDVTGLARDLAGGAAIARVVKDRIRAEQRLTASVGVAPNKFLAKLASDLEKPDGLVVFPKEDVARRLWPLPVERLWGVGPKSAEVLHRAGLRTIGDIAAVSEPGLAALVGPRAGAHLSGLARGDDDRPVSAGRESKSISEERTYADDLTDAREIDRELLARTEGVARSLRRHGLLARTVHLKVRTGDFETSTRALTLHEPTDLAEPLIEGVRALFRDRIELDGRGIRLLGIGVSGLTATGSVPAALFADPATERSRKLAAASDAVNDKLGEDVMTRASLLRRKSREASSLPTVD